MSLENEVKAHVKYWKKHLRILDWQINVKIHEDPEEFPHYGRMDHHRNDQVALLNVLNPENIPEDWWGCRDVEVTVVHELIHTRFIFCLLPDKHTLHHQEMAIETVAKALVANRRGISIEDLK